MRVVRALAAAVLLVGWLAAPTGIASADCTVAGDFGAAAGCPPPGDDSDSSGSGGGDNWPPTAVDWPPGSGSGSGGGASDTSGGDHGDAKSTPIVMPLGQSPPAAPAASGSSAPTEESKPIVAVDAPPR